jgi:gamma-glutamyltranspeptidase
MPVAELAGHAHAIRVGTGGLEAACDPRADGVPVGD